MTPLSPAYSSDHQSLCDRPERSRNAKAQARHRAKRKAYIEQLEQTVTKLQTVLALSPDQVATLPPPLVRIRELEEENEILHREIDDLRRQLEQRNARLRPDITRRTDLLTLADDGDRDGRRRRLADSTLYMNYSASSSQSSTDSQSHAAPPPLMIPPSTNNNSHTASQLSAAYQRTAASSSFLPSYGLLGYPMPSTPSGSSSTSSPSFSQPSDYEPPAQAHTRPATAAAAAAPAPQNLLSPYSHAANDYNNFVKLEDECYQHHMTNTNAYSSTLHPFAAAQTSVRHWHSYATERAQ